MIGPMTVYRWSDGWWVTVSIDPSARISGRYVPGKGKMLTSRRDDGVVPVVFTLRHPSRVDDRWSVTHLVRGGEGLPQVLPISCGAPSWQQPEVPTGEARKRLLGFLLDLGIERPTRGVRSSIVTQAGDAEKRAADIPYPRWVEDPARWEGQYEEAKRFILRRLGTVEEERAAGRIFRQDCLPDEQFLGWLSELEIYSPEYYSDDTWHAKMMGQSKKRYHHRYFHGLVDQVVDGELLLPSSSRRAWEAEHVTSGEWVLPEPLEVEVFQLLGNQLPLLWGPEKIDAWLQERGARLRAR